MKNTHANAPRIEYGKNTESIGGMVMANLRRCRILVGISAVLLVFIFFLGCTRLKTSTKSSERPEPVAKRHDKTPAPLYYDFEDVLVPSELKVDKKKSFVYHAPDFSAGVLVLKGRVEVNSLVRFFDNNMAKDNWRLVSSFKSPRTIMFFNKPNRGCIINITEKQFTTEVEIWVAPTMVTGEEGLLK
ncbi:MAG: hypothetical protein JRJ42_06090 [Deltaproteobacteria bacterium]|nr:hypothetical protein [Deltaproteobacteria bacterium]MBW2019638.1 hypothetical protein [Deltaproteobacteria bacterium]MBW2074174.1 hypothetical protein [Deltaproteobacteria bacterium]RLB81150.1 MAG: hypothetical protein DRH17_10035 [Deltaproteobacteria bacterium]